MNITASRALARRQAWKRARRHWQLYLFLLLPVAYLILFSYVPMVGAQIAFRDYRFLSIRAGADQYAARVPLFHFGGIPGSLGAGGYAQLRAQRTLEKSVSEHFVFAALYFHSGDGGHAVADDQSRDGALCAYSFAALWGVAFGFDGQSLRIRAFVCVVRDLATYGLG